MGLRDQLFQMTLCGANGTSAKVSLGDRCADMMNSTATLMGLSIGHRVGLFEVLDRLPPSSSAHIAEEARLNERYVREWLSAMYSSDIVDYNEADGTWHLPKENATFLTGKANTNICVPAQFFTLFGMVQDELVECFKSGGGVPYEHHRRFHEVMAEESGQTVLPALLDSIIPLVPGLTDRLIDGITVLDVGCGRGKALMLLAQTFPRSKFVGYDLCPDTIEFAVNEVNERGLQNLEFKTVDLANFDSDAPKDKFDLITAFDAIHDQGQPQHALDGICHALKPDGVFLMQDINGTSDLVEDKKNNHMAAFLYTISYYHCMTVSLAQQNGAGLGTMWGEKKARKMLSRAGFNHVQVKKISQDTKNYFIASK